MNKVLFITMISITSLKATSQNFDSLHVYAISASACYYVSIGRELIRTVTDPIVFKKASEISKINHVLHDTIIGKCIKKIQRNNFHIILSFEFFSNGQVVKTVGFSPFEEVFIDYVLYKYDKQDLKYLDKYIVGLTEIIK